MSRQPPLYNLPIAEDHVCWICKTLSLGVSVALPGNIKIILCNLPSGNQTWLAGKSLSCENHRAKWRIESIESEHHLQMDDVPWTNPVVCMGFSPCFRRDAGYPTLPRSQGAQEVSSVNLRAQPPLGKSTILRRGLMNPSSLILNTPKRKHGLVGDEITYLEPFGGCLILGGWDWWRNRL